MKTKTHLVALLVGGAVAVACGDPASTGDDGFVAASEATRAELGVTRWSTKDAPASIEGYDDDAKVVVSLKHFVAHETDVVSHAFELREHANTAVTQFRIETNAQGIETFVLLRDEGNAPFVDHVLERMKDDLQPTEPSLTTQTLGAASTGVRPADVPWTTPSVQLVCGKAELITGADTCMKHKTSIPQEAKAWALACTAYVEQNAGATRDDTACKQVGVNPCSCSDLTNGAFYSGDGKEVCTYAFAGVGQYEHPEQCTDPKVECPKQIQTCTPKETWCKQDGHSC